MRRITPQTPPPSSLVEFIRSTPALDYESLRSPAKDELRAHLFAEQDGRCAYCERPLVLDSTTTKIEHFHPQNLTSGTSQNACIHRLGARNLSRIDVNIKNLLLCCLGEPYAGSGAKKTCDTLKGNTHICADFYSPKNLPSTVTSIVAVRQSGRAVPVVYPGTTEAAEKVVDEVLNLNDFGLKSKRSSVYFENQQAFIREFHRQRGHRPAAVLRRDAAARLREAAHTAPFASTLESLAQEIVNGPSGPGS